MNKIIAISAILLMSLFLSHTAVADTDGTATAGAQVTIEDGTGNSGANLVVDPSPGVVMKWQTTANAYGMSSLNTSASDGNRNMYGIWSGYSGYYQELDPTTGTVTQVITGLTAPGDPSGTGTPTAFADWTAMGGGS